MDDRSLDARMSLAALRTMDRFLMIQNPCVAVPGQTLWVSPEYRREQLKKKKAFRDGDLAAIYSYRTELPSGSYIEQKEWKKILAKAQNFSSDSYICHGGIGQGSGRSIFVEDHQLKGVGRTNHAV